MKEWIFHVCRENWGNTLLGRVFISKGIFIFLYDSDLGTFKWGGGGGEVRLSYYQFIARRFLAIMF